MSTHMYAYSSTSSVIIDCFATFTNHEPVYVFDHCTDKEQLNQMNSMDTD